MQPTEQSILELIPHAFEKSELTLSGRNSGKVRDGYVLPDGKRLLVTTDRLSAFDRNLAVIPYKGQPILKKT